MPWKSPSNQTIATTLDNSLEGMKAYFSRMRKEETFAATDSVLDTDEPPTVSVLMRIRDGIDGYPPDFLKRALDSVFLANSGCDAEVIAVNNGSVDSTFDFLHDYATDLPARKLIVIDLDENVGEAEALNIAAQEAIGAYFIQLTARSYFAGGALAKMAQTLGDNSLGIGFTFGRMTVEGARVRYHVPPHWGENKSMYDKTFLANFFMFRREAFHDRGLRFVEYITVDGQPVGICDRDFYMQMVHELGWRGYALSDWEVITYHFTGQNQMSSVVEANRAAIDKEWLKRWGHVL